MTRAALSTGQLPLPLGSVLTDALRDTLAAWVVDGWHHKAACAGREDDLWFPDDDEPDPVAEKEARRICHCCPVLASCRAAGVLGDEYGIWGAASRPQRRVLAEKIRYGLPVGMVLDRSFPLPDVTENDQDDEGVAA